VKKVFGLLALLLSFVSCFPSFAPTNTSFSATTSVESGDIFGIKLYSTTSRIIMKPGESKQIDLSLQLKETSSGRVEPGSQISDYRLTVYNPPWFKVSFYNSSIKLNEGSTATIEVAKDAPMGQYTIEFMASRTRGSLGEYYLRTTFEIEIRKP
jgi:hypothetical protein